MIRSITRTHRSWLAALIATALLGTNTGAQELTARQVAAPASDIVAGIVRLPDPAAMPTSSRAAVVPLRFEAVSDGRWVAELALPIERAGAVSLGLLSTDAGSWNLLVSTNGGAPAPIAQAFALERRVALVGDALPGWIIDRYDLRDAPAGTWNLRVEALGTRAPARGWLIARTASELALETWVTTHELVAGRPIALVARATGHDAGTIDAARALLDVDGAVQELVLLDDGLHDDGARGDGLFGALLPPSVSGFVRVHVELAGTTRDGAAFQRAAELAFSVLEPRVLCDGNVRTSDVDAQHVELALGALALGPTQRFQVAAEVWGTGADGVALPVCWLARMVAPRAHPAESGAWELPLVLDTRWIDVAQAQAPFELRNLRVQDPDTAIVFDALERVVLANAALPDANPAAAREITAEMLTGGTSLTLAPASITRTGPNANAAASPIKPALVLVHGYCSGGGVWPPADFTQPKLAFLDPNANRTHDQFALLIAQQANAAGLTSFGVVGHSQGGPAALHLLTFYASGLDLASGGRRIQSVASPYQGTPLASWGGFTCGVNNDMTPSGSTAWLAGIPSWARAEVFYWTTSNSGSVCNFFTSLLLSDPEDGTVEQFRGQLPGANNMGHVVGWCHTTGMSNPANYTDHARNVLMNAAAAR